MKRLLLSLASTILAFCGYAQTEETVCHTPSTEKFAMFASNKDFNKAHKSPRKYLHVSLAGGEMITFKCADGKDANAYLLKKSNSNNWIFVFQEWWGLNDNVKRQSEDIFNDVGNANVLALDMFDGKVAKDRETAGKYMQEFKQDRGDAIIKGAVAYAGSNAKIGTVGWCFGGGQSLLAALAAGKQAAACVVYYGMPVEDVNKLKTLNCDVLDIFATQDKWINQDVTTRFEANMKAAGKKLTVKKYDADHGFANPSNPLGAMNETAMKDAYKATVDFFKARLK